MDFFDWTEKKLNVGDSVTLKIGGYLMNVVELIPGEIPSVECVWIAKKGLPQREIYPACTLEWQIPSKATRFSEKDEES